MAPANAIVGGAVAAAQPITATTTIYQLLQHVTPLLGIDCTVYECTFADELYKNVQDLLDDDEWLQFNDQQKFTARVPTKVLAKIRQTIAALQHKDPHSTSCHHVHCQQCHSSAVTHTLVDLGQLPPSSPTPIRLRSPPLFSSQGPAVQHARQLSYSRFGASGASPAPSLLTPSHLSSGALTQILTSLQEGKTFVLHELQGNTLHKQTIQLALVPASSDASADSAATPSNALPPAALRTSQERSLFTRRRKSIPLQVSTVAPLIEGGHHGLLQWSLQQSSTSPRIVPSQSRSSGKQLSIGSIAGLTATETLQIAHISDILLGKQSAAFLHSQNAEVNDNQCLTIVATGSDGKRVELDLEAESSGVTAIWLTGLDHLRSAIRPPARTESDVQHRRSATEFSMQKLLNRFKRDNKNNDTTAESIHTASTDTTNESASLLSRTQSSKHSSEVSANSNMPPTHGRFGSWLDHNMKNLSIRESIQAFANRAKRDIQQATQQRQSLAIKSLLDTVKQLQRGHVMTGYFVVDATEEHLEESLLLFYEPHSTCQHSVSECGSGSLYWCSVETDSYGDVPDVSLMRKQRIPGQHLSLCQIQDIVLGKRTTTFRLPFTVDAQESCCFSIMTQQQTHIDLEASSAKESSQWSLSVKRIMQANRKLSGGLVTLVQQQQQEPVAGTPLISPSHAHDNDPLSVFSSDNDSGQNTATLLSPRSPLSPLLTTITEMRRKQQRTFSTGDDDSHTNRTASSLHRGSSSACWSDEEDAAERKEQPPSPLNAPTTNTLTLTQAATFITRDTSNPPVTAPSASGPIPIVLTHHRSPLTGQGILVHEGAFKSPRSRSVSFASPSHRPLAAASALHDVDLLADPSPTHSTTSEVSRQLLPLNDYQLLMRIGFGTYGSVYKAIDKRSGSVVAIKMVELDVSPSTAGHSERRASLSVELAEEISIMKHCASPYIVSYHTSFVSSQVIYIVMQYCAGGSLADLMTITQTTLTEAQLATVMHHALLGLQYFHATGRVHRDVKAANILLSEDGHCLLADFGVSVQASATAPVPLTRSKSVAVGGSPYWMAPEVMAQAQSSSSFPAHPWPAETSAAQSQSSYAAAADVWSLGITAIELAAGQPPLADLHPMKVLLIAPNKPSPKIPADIASDFSSECHSFVAACLTKDPAKRPTTEQLLQHPFVLQHADQCKDNDVMKQLLLQCLPLIDRYREMEAQTLAQRHQPHANMQPSTHVPTHGGQQRFHHQPDRSSIDDSIDSISSSNSRTSNNVSTHATAFTSARSGSSSSKRRVRSSARSKALGKSSHVSALLMPADALNSSISLTEAENEMHNRSTSPSFQSAKSYSARQLNTSHSASALLDDAASPRAMSAYPTGHRTVLLPNNPVALPVAQPVAVAVQPTH